MGHSEFDPAARERRPCNAGHMVGAKRALKPQQVWAMRFWLEREGRLRDRALFERAIDSKRPSAFGARITARIRCGGQRCRSFTRPPAISERFRSSSDTPRSRAPSGILASTSRMRSISPSTSKSEWRGRSNRTRRPGGPAPTLPSHRRTTPSSRWQPPAELSVSGSPLQSNVPAAATSNRQQT